MGGTVVKKIKRVLITLDEVVSKQNNLKEADRLNEKYKEIDSAPSHYSVEQVIGLPAQDKYDS